MDEAEQVLERLRRIRALDRREAPTTMVLAELRKLVVEAEAWARLDGDERAEQAVERLAERVGDLDRHAPVAVMAVPG